MPEHSAKLSQDLVVFRNLPVCRFALVLSSLFLTGLKLAFDSPSSVIKRKRRRIPLQPPLLLESKAWTMEEMCGHLLKQSDVFGLWKSRYFRLACLSHEELALIQGIDSIILKEGGRRFVMLYWSCDASMAMSSKYRNNPRGAFLLDGCWVEQTDHKKDLLTLHGLRNAQNVKSQFPPMYLKALNQKALQRWVSAISFASIAVSFPLSDSECSYPYKNISCAMGLVSSPTSEVVHESMYFRLIKSTTMRVFLLSWDTKEQADSRPIIAQNIYELSQCSVSLLSQCPQVLVVEKVRDFMMLNLQMSFGKLFLRVDDRSLAEELAAAISSECIIEPMVVQEALVDELVFGDETVVDELTFDQLNGLEENTENTGDYSNKPFKSLQKQREVWESPRPLKLSPVAEDDNESRRSSIGSSYSGRRSSFGMLFN